MHSMDSFRVDQRSPSCWRFITRLASLWIRACRRTLCIWISQRLSTMPPTKGCFWNSLSTESAGTSAVVRELSVWTRSAVLGPRIHFKSFSSSIGVPQSSILCPLLFLVYVNDLPPVIQNLIAFFVDDSKCSSVIESLQDCDWLQKDLDSCMAGAIIGT